MTPKPPKSLSIGGSIRPDRPVSEPMNDCMWNKLVIARFAQQTPNRPNACWFSNLLI